MKPALILLTAVALTVLTGTTALASHDAPILPASQPRRPTAFRTPFSTTTHGSSAAPSPRVQAAPDYTLTDAILYHDAWVRSTTALAEQ